MGSVRESFRDEGFILEVDYVYSIKHCISISWLLLRLLHTDSPRCHIRYDVKVNRVAESEFEWKQVTNELEDGQDATGSLTLRRRNVHLLHGIVVHFRRSGTIGRFSFPALLTSLVLGAGTLSLAQLLLDLVWQYCYPILGWHSNKRISAALYGDLDAELYDDTVKPEHNDRGELKKTK